METRPTVYLTGHEVSRCCRFARQMARRVLAEASPWTDPTDVLMRHFGVDVWVQPLEAVDAVLVPILRGPESGRFCVVVNMRFIGSDYVKVEELRWTCAHELGHLACGHHLRYPEYQSDPRQEKLAEIEANTFAEEFLMPAHEVQKVAHLPVEDLCGHFQVTRTVMERRLRSYRNYLAACAGTPALIAVPDHHG